LVKNYSQNGQKHRRGDLRSILRTWGAAVLRPYMFAALRETEVAGAPLVLDVTIAVRSQIAARN
jgi:hypothetical protein